MSLHGQQPPSLREALDGREREPALASYRALVNALLDRAEAELSRAELDELYDLLALRYEDWLGPAAS